MLRAVPALCRGKGFRVSLEVLDCLGGEILDLGLQWIGHGCGVNNGKQQGRTTRTIVLENCLQAVGLGD